MPRIVVCGEDRQRTRGCHATVLWFVTRGAIAVCRHESMMSARCNRDCHPGQTGPWATIARARRLGIMEAPTFNELQEGTYVVLHSLTSTMEYNGLLCTVKKTSTEDRLAVRVCETDKSIKVRRRNIFYCRADDDDDDNSMATSTTLVAKSRLPPIINSMKSLLAGTLGKIWHRAARIDQETDREEPGKVHLLCQWSPLACWPLCRH